MRHPRSSDERSFGAVKFEDSFVSKADRYSLGVEVDSGVYYAAIPVSNQQVDYAEYYELTADEYERFKRTVSSNRLRGIVSQSSTRSQTPDQTRY
jgi:hypothetical protein